MYIGVSEWQMLSNFTNEDRDVILIVICDFDYLPLIASVLCAQCLYVQKAGVYPS